MGASKNSSDSFGFLTVVDLGGSTLIGGLLLLNDLGRPLEFHCTEPVKPNRAQQILYGPTLAPYLYGEQIGQALLAQSKMRPHLVFTDTPAALALRDFVDRPVLLIGPRPADSSSSDDYLAFPLGDSTVWHWRRYAADQQTAQQYWTADRHDWDLSEPFRRIHEAIQETQKAAA